MLTEDQVNEITKQIEAVSRSLEDRFQTFETRINERLSTLESRLDGLAEDLETHITEITNKLDSMGDRIWNCENGRADPWH